MNDKLLLFLLDNIIHPSALLEDGMVIYVNDKLAKIIKQQVGEDVELHKESILRFQYLENEEKVNLFGTKYELSITNIGDYCLLKFIDKIDNYVDELLLAIGHEIKTPLSIIRAGVDQSESDAIIKEMINKSIQRITSLSDDLTELELSNWINLKKSSFEVNDVIDRIKNTYDVHMKHKNISLTIENLGDSPWTTKGGLSILLKIINPLIDNAINSFHKTTIINKKISVVFSNLDDNYSITIKDTGVGIKKENLENVFKPFFQENKERGGQSKGGLGLPIIKRLVNRLKGTITIDSVKGVGTTIVVAI